MPIIDRVEHKDDGSTTLTVGQMTFRAGDRLEVIGPRRFVMHWGEFAWWIVWAFVGGVILSRW